MGNMIIKLNRTSAELSRETTKVPIVLSTPIAAKALSESS
jgi:hypothetical protein